MKSALESARKSKSSHGRRARVWWQHYHGAYELHAAIAGLERVLVICRHQPQWGTSFLSAASVFAESLIVFPLATHAAFSALQSRPHEIWARFFGSSMKDDLRYTPSDCFETFPFPNQWDGHPALEAAGQTYYHSRGFCCNFGPATSGWTVFDNDWTGSPSCPATIRSNGVSSNQDSSSCVFGGTCGMP